MRKLGEKKLGENILGEKILGYRVRADVCVCSVQGVGEGISRDHSVS